MREYEILAKAEKKLRREISKEMYFFHRSQVEARAINGSNNELQLVPIFDVLPHSDSPNARIIFDIEEGYALLVALHDLKEGEEVTVNYGTGLQPNAKTQ